MSGNAYSSNKAMFRFFPLILVLILAANTCSGAVFIHGSPEEVPEGLSQPLNYAEIVKAVDMEAVTEHVRFFSSFMTRSTGYPGSYRSAEYVYNQFIEAGLKNVSYEEFTVADAIDHGANVTILSTGETFAVFPLKPNFGAPSTTPPSGVTGKLIYARKGYLTDLDGLDIQGNIILLDWDSGSRWINAAKFGAKAVIFLSPEYVPDIGVPRTVKVPYTFPRFCVEEETARVLMQHLGDVATVVARTYWENVRGLNVIGFLEGTGTEEERQKIIILSSYYDSGSIAPSWAPGADESMGIASLIEFAKWLSRNPPRYTVMFVAFSGHHQGLAGAMKFLEDWVYPAYDPTKRAVGVRFIGQFNLDLSGGSSTPFMARQGDYMRFYGGYQDTGTDPLLRDHLTKRSVYGEGGVVEEINEGTEKKYEVIVQAYVNMGRNLALPYERARFEYTGRRLDSEPFNVYVENMGITITTAFDPRFSYERPWDTFERLNDESFENLKTQLEFTYCLLARILNTKFETLRVWILYDQWHYPPRYDRIDVANRKAEAANEFWRPIIGQVGYYNTTKAWYDPVPHALVYIHPMSEWIAWANIGVGETRWPIEVWTLTDENGSFEVWGAAASIGGPTELEAFVFDNETGIAVYVPDYGEYQYCPRQIYTGGMQIAFYENIRIGWLAVFKAASAVIFDAIDPTTFSPPRIFGTSSALTLMPSLYESAGHTALKKRSSMVLSDLSYSMIVAGFPPSTPSEMVFMSPTVYRYPITFLVNLKGGGYTFEPGEQYTFEFSVLQFAENLHDVSKDRLDILKLYNPGVTSYPEYGVNERVLELVRKARDAYENRRFSEANLYASEAWRLGRDAYFHSRSSMEDASFAVPILAAFLIPFTIIGEKLMLSLPGRKKIISLLLIMFIILSAFYLVHPGFQIAASPVMIVIGFSILTLIVPIALITFGGGLSAIKFIRVRLMGKHEIEVARTSVAVWSFTVGVENMRKRKFRTTLVLVSLLLMVVAFTNLASIRGIKITKPTPIVGNPLYNGVYTRRVLWGSGNPELGEYLFELLTTKYKGEAQVLPRSWVYTDVAVSTEGKFGFRLSYNSRSVILHSLLGLTPSEVNITRLDVFLDGNGTWFLPDQRYVCILPSSVANELGIGNPGVNVNLFTRPLKVIGIISDEFAQTSEVDGEKITPIMLNYPGGRNPYDVHISPSETILVPYYDVLSLGGQVASISIKTPNASSCEKAALEIFNLIPDIFIYASYNNQTVMLTQASVATAMGLEAQIIPFILLSLSILSIMLGNVYERMREIAIYGSLGLSPMHVSFMFLAESLTYALVGGILGYVIAMGSNIIISTIYPGVMIQNMSSSAVVYALLISMLTMLISSVYPLFKASRLVVPSLERKWTIKTKPIGDNWSIPLPFYVTSGEEVGGILAFLREFFSAHIGEVPPDFSILSMELEEGELEGMPFIGLNADVRIAPYESGVHQIARNLFKRTDGRWEMVSLVTRLSGAPPEWLKLNARFVDSLRKQLLLWRSMPLEERERYMEIFRKTGLK